MLTGGRAIRAVAAIAITAALVVPSTAAQAIADQSPDRSTEPSLTVLRQPTEVAPDGRFSVALSVGDAPAGGDVAVDIYDRITNRDDLEQSRTDRPANALATFETIPLQPDEDEQRVDVTIFLYDRGQEPPEGSGAWAWRLTEPGVYPVRIRLRGSDGGDLVTIVTYLIRRPSADADAPEASVALLATVTAPTPGEALDPARVDELVGVLDEHPDVPVSLFVDPDALDRTDAESDGADTIAALRDLLARERVELLGAPFTTVDIPSLATAGLGGTLGDQARLGGDTLDDLLGSPGTPVWWEPDQLDAASLFGLRAVGVEHLVVAPSTVIGEAPLAPTPLLGADASFTVTSTVDDLPAEPVDDPVLAAHQWTGRLAATATIAGDVGSATVGRVDLTTADLDVLALVLDALDADNQVLRTDTLSGQFDATPPATTPLALAAPRITPLGSYADARRAVLARSASFDSMRIDDGTPRTDEQIALARTERRDLTDEQRIAGLTEINDSLDRSFAAISTAADDRITLGARNATIPLPIRSDADEPLRVRINLSSSNRLDLPRNHFDTVVQPGRTTVSIPVEARTSGDIPMQVTITTPDDGVVLAQSRYTIRSTAVSGVGIVLTVGAAGFLALWWGRHIWRSRRDGEADVDADEPTGDEPDGRPTEDDDDLFVHDHADRPM
ncbi:MAG: hypothetical protein KF906_09980 [Actinobacteria bacterium]|nr:hypothetical protein [Actinomycetota bacterium]